MAAAVHRTDRADSDGLLETVVETLREAAAVEAEPARGSAVPAPAERRTGSTQPVAADHR